MKPDYDPDFFPGWMELETRYRDLDPLNHVNNAIYSTFYEEARIHFVFKIPEFQAGYENNESFVLGQINITFLHPITYPATILVGSGIRSIGNTSISSFQAIYDKETKKLCSTAEARGVWFDVKRGRPTALPEIAELENYLLDESQFEGS